MERLLSSEAEHILFDHRLWAADRAQAELDEIVTVVRVRAIMTGAPFPAVDNGSFKLVGTHIGRSVQSFSEFGPVKSAVSSNVSAPFIRSILPILK